MTIEQFRVYMKIVIVGGHLSPAFAVIDSLPKDTKILFIGRKFALEGDKALSLEYQTITKHNIPYSVILTGRLQRVFTKHTIPSLFKTPYGFIQSFFILRNFKPDVVLSFGGYLSLPVGFSAFFLGIPIVIHEQTLEAGIANRILSFFAKKICVSWESSRKFFPREKTILTGNPVRKFQKLDNELTFFGRHSGNQALPEPSRISMLQRDAGQAVRRLLESERPRSRRPELTAEWASMTGLANIDKELPILYITGGSSGSHFINTLVEGCVKELLEKFVIIHQTGDAERYRDFERLNNLRDNLPSKLEARYFLIKFVEPKDVGSYLKKAHLVVSRAGINTITELIFFKKPSLLIPLPYSQNNEQIKNALFLKSLGLGEVVYQDSLNHKKFLEILIEMFDNIDRYKISNQALPDQDDKGKAAQKIVEVVKYEAKVKEK